MFSVHLPHPNSLNILIQRILPEAEIAGFKETFPQHDIRVIPPQASIQSHLPWAEVILSNPNPQVVLEKAKQLKWLQLLSSGFDGYDSLEQAPFKVTTAHGIHTYTIAKHVLMMMLMFERKQRFFENRQREHHWDRQARLPGLLKGQTLGLIGFGAIAGELVKQVQPFNLQIQAVTKHPQSKAQQQNVSIEGMEFLNTLLSTSDHIVVTLPSTPETRQILTANRISQIKQGAYLYNVGRGDLIEESALTEALENGHLAGAALDVFEHEPLNPESPLWTLDNCIVTPHIAGHHKALDIDILNFFAENLKRFDNGESLLNEANFQRGY
jgi:phosphoglycerate dehydrogenase-like enzyme